MDNAIFKEWVVSDMVPEPVQIVQANSNHTFTLNEHNLKNLLTRDDMKDRYVVVISVAGAFRKGKSFLLNFFLKYLHAQYKKRDVTNWLGKENEPLNGFTWKCGSNSVTTGILMWSEVFTYDYANGEKIAIILLDTQGTFDHGSTVRDWTTIFALSTLLSSTQCYNLPQNIQEDDLQNLRLFAEYGCIVNRRNGTKPFQHLQMIVRDWSYAFEDKYGAAGGKDVLNRRLQETQELTSESRTLRQRIKDCFDKITCYLMPHPGLVVANNPKFIGQLNQIDAEFKDHLKILVPELLAPEKLIIKRINGEKVRVEQWIQYFTTYMEAFRGENLPVPENIFLSTAKVVNMTAINKAMTRYDAYMTENCGGLLPTTDDRLVNYNVSARLIAMDVFNSAKLGDEELISTYRTQLMSQLDNQYRHYKQNNDLKKIAAQVGAVTLSAVAIKLGSNLLGAFRRNR